jgi:hypothetical protein
MSIAYSNAVKQMTIKCLLKTKDARLMTLWYKRLSKILFGLSVLGIFCSKRLHTQVIPQGGKTGSTGSVKTKSGRFSRFLLKTPM